MTLVIMAVCVLVWSSWTGEAVAAEFTDPMKPMNYTATTAGPNTDALKEKKKTDLWTLSAVLLSDNRSVAVVNGQTLRLGDLLEGYTLTGIYQDRVVFNGKGRKLVLKRSGTGLKKKSVQRK
jgi:hypothetical protein